MKLTCPECSTQFLIDPAAIGVNGRTVRCSKCSGTWFVASEPDVMDLYDHKKDIQAQADFVKGALQETPQLGDADIPKEDHTLESSVVSNSVLAHELAKPDVASQEENMQPIGIDEAPHTILRDKREKNIVRRRLIGVSMIWGVTLAILAMTVLAAYVLRAQIMEQFPVTRKIYKAFNVEAPIFGLELYALETRYGDKNGVQTLSVSGKIKNVDVKVRDIPLVSLTFQDAEGKIISSWVIEPSQSVLQPNAVLTFSGEYPNPPNDAANLATNFIVEEAPQMQNVPVENETP